MRRPDVGLIVAGCACLFFGVSAAAASTYSSDFDSFAEGSFAEDLSVPGVKFSASPPGSWEITESFFTTLTLGVLYQPLTPGTLDISFATPVSRCSFRFAQSQVTSASNVAVEAFKGATVVGSLSQVTTADTDFGEGLASFSSAVPFDRIRVSSAPPDALIAIDDLQADVVPLPPAPPPDSDRDGIPDTLDNCSFVFNPDHKDTDGDGVGNACDNCPNDFNPFQTDVCGAGKDSAAAILTALGLKRVRLKAAPSGTVRVTGVLDTSAYGGLDGFVTALRTRVSAGASTSTFFRQGNVLAVNVSGAGLTPPGQTMLFPACLSLIQCGSTSGETISFLRKGATNLFTVNLRAQGKTFPPPLSSMGVTVTLSLGGIDHHDDIDCKVGGKRKQVVSCRKPPRPRTGF